MSDGPLAAPPAVLEGVTFTYGGPGAPPVLEDVNLTIEDRDFLGLIGPNGGGKTTLLRLLLGLVAPTSGRVTVLGRTPREVRRHVGYVPQRAQVDEKVPATVLDVVLTGRLGLRPWGFFYRRGDVERARAALGDAGLADHADRRYGELSGGQRQRVLIARALASDARLLLLDEPMAGIDLHVEQGILETLRRLNERMPIVLVSHDVGFISTHVKRVACLNRRILVNRAQDVTRDIISEMYRAAGPVHALGHRGECPLHGEGGEGHR